MLLLKGVGNIFLSSQHQVFFDQKNKLWAGDGCQESPVCDRVISSKVDKHLSRGGRDLRRLAAALGQERGAGTVPVIYGHDIKGTLQLCIKEI